ncbi:MAG TPA: FG-GAP-like repeat-containing protein [Polyangia bacterium]|nr:FG-GAP-like repeat-containing protein [Polyangia bacterium]
MRSTRAALGVATVLAVVASASPARALQGPKPSAATPQKLKLPDRPGSIKGLSDEASVNVFSAQVNYSVPMALPKGAGGFGPELAFNYLGELGNGSMGIGWTLGSIAVRRTLRYGVPSYTDADELELNGIGPGGRLIPSGDGKTFWVIGQARTIRVTREGDRFRVDDGTGTQYLLGVSLAGRETDGQGRVSGWLVESVTNPSGQQIQFNYDRESGQTYLDSIAWGPGPVKYSVVPHYHGRKDVTTSYRTGYEVRTSRLLDKVTVMELEGGAATVIKTFTLVYDEDFSASRLETITMSGTDRSGSPDSLPPLTFGYARPTIPTTVSLTGVDAWQLNERDVSLLDVDGDGMSDLVRMELGNHQYKKNLGGTFSAAVPMSGAADVDLGSGTIVDVDGDSRPDLVHIVDGTWRVSRLDHGSWQAPVTWGGSTGVPISGSNVVLADLNGDGRIDVVRGGTGGLLVNFNTKNGLGPTVTAPQISPSEAFVEPGSNNVRFVDFNGDGNADVVYLTDAWMKIYLGRGDGTFVVWNRIFWPWGAAAFDVNDIHIADIDRDGSMDVVRFSAGSVTWYPGTPNGHLADASFARHLNRPENASADVVTTTADVLGFGSQNIIWSSPRGLWALDLTGPAHSGMLVSVDNGQGKTTTFTYRSSAQLAADAEKQGTPWQDKLPVVIPVPVETKIDLGDGAPLRIAHHGVRDGFWDGVERRLGGFLVETTEVAATSDPSASLITETHYHAGLGDERVLRGVTSSVQRSDGNGQVVDVMRMTWQALALVGMPDDPMARRPIKLSDEGNHYQGLASPIVTRTTYDQFDGQGRAQLETELGFTATSGDERITVRHYADDPSTWVRDRVYEQLVQSADGTIVSGTQTYFGGPSGSVLPLGSVGLGFVRRTDGYDGVGWPTQSSVSYDAYGNPVALYADGVSRSVGYDVNLFPSSESVDPGNGGSLLTWHMTWDHVLGTPSTLQDPNSDQTAVAYDSLGREISIAQNGAAPHARFSYDWSAPHPKTYSWVFDGSASQLGAEPFPSGRHWHQTAAVANSEGESLFSATPAGDGTWLISGWAARDERGHVVTMAEPFSASIMEPSSIAPGTRYQTFTYDMLSRLQTQHLPNGGMKTIAYSNGGFCQTVSSSELADVSSCSDGLQRVTRTERDVNSVTLIDSLIHVDSDADVESVDAVYDAADRILSMELQRGTALSVVHEFEYDPLGRLKWARDPDTGPRTLSYDDRNFLRQHQNGVGQIVYFDYDGAGRLTRRGETLDPSAATDYSYSYDSDAEAFQSGCHAAGRLASATEPTGDAGAVGRARFCYDAFGRQDALGRTIATPGGERTGTEQTELSPSGLVLQTVADDGFAVAYQYDPAGRLICARPPPAEQTGKCQRLAIGQVGGSSDDYWVADLLDAAGRVLQDHYGNGATQAYGYDQLGLTASVELKSPVQTPDLFKIAVSRNKYGAPTIVTDEDGGHGLDHSATYTYDGAARLTDATLGAEADPSNQYAFTFRYSPLQNMRLRVVTQGGPASPKDIGVLAGSYRYGERGYGPRQLTSVVAGGAP